MNGRCQWLIFLSYYYYLNLFIGFFYKKVISLNRSLNIVFYNVYKLLGIAFLDNVYKLLSIAFYNIIYKHKKNYYNFYFYEYKQIMIIIYYNYNFKEINILFSAHIIIHSRKKFFINRYMHNMCTKYSFIYS